MLDKDGVFHQYREYDSNHRVILEIGYHQEKGLGKGDVLHIHVHQKPGIDFHSDPSTEKRKLTREEYQKYKRFFKESTSPSLESPSLSLPTSMINPYHF